MDDILPSRFGRSLFRVSAFLKLQQWVGGRGEGAAPGAGAVLMAPCCSPAQLWHYLGDGSLDGHGMDPGHGGAAPLGAACVWNRAEFVPWLHRQGLRDHQQELLKPLLHCLPCCASQRQSTAECTSAKRCWLNHGCPWSEISGCNSLAKSWLCFIILTD